MTTNTEKTLEETASFMNVEGNSVELAKECRKKELFFRDVFVPVYQASKMLLPYFRDNVMKILSSDAAKGVVRENIRAYAGGYKKRYEMMHGQLMDSLNLFAIKVFHSTEPLTQEHCIAIKGFFDKVAAELSNSTKKNRTVPKDSMHSAAEQLLSAVETIYLVIGFSPKARATWLSAHTSQVNLDHRSGVSWKSLADNSSLEKLKLSKKVATAVIDLWAPRIYTGSRIGKAQHEEHWATLFQTELQRKTNVVPDPVPLDLEIEVLADNRFSLSLRYAPSALTQLLSKEEMQTKRYQELMTSLHFRKECELHELQDSIRTATAWYLSVSAKTHDYTNHLQAIREESVVAGLKKRMSCTFSPDELKKVLPVLMADLGLKQ